MIFQTQVYPEFLNKSTFASPLETGALAQLEEHRVLVDEVEPKPQMKKRQYTRSEPAPKQSRFVNESKCEDL